ncbi:MAG TPA: hypothetical protein VEP90_24295 [Methylomirabilota bacterium]|nr:hypothetical protein [Methylomirabilota bacterium]
MRRKCRICGKLTEKWQRINGGPWHCYDGCYSTIGYDRRTSTGKPLWLLTKKEKKHEVGI